jgi:hypothetical protein
MKRFTLDDIMTVLALVAFAVIAAGLLWFLASAASAAGSPF